MFHTANFCQISQAFLVLIQFVSIVQQSNILNNKLEINSNFSKKQNDQIRSSFLSLNDASFHDYKRGLNKKTIKRNKSKFTFETNIFKLKQPFDLFQKNNRKNERVKKKLKENVKFVAPTHQRSIKSNKQESFNNHLASNESSFFNISEKTNITQPDEISQLILAHIDEADDEDVSNEAQEKENNELENYDEDYLIKYRSDTQNRSILNAYFNRIHENEFSHDAEKILNDDGKVNKENNFTKDEEFFESSSVQQQHSIENLFNVTLEIIDSRNETEYINALDFKEENQFENIETENFLPTSPGTTILNSTTSITDNLRFEECIVSCGTDHDCVRTNCLIDSTYIG